MEAVININNNYNSLDAICKRLQQQTDYTCSKEYDIWDHRVDSNGQMEQCVVLKKSGMHGLKLYASGDNQVKLDYIVPSKVLNMYFGPKGGKARKNALELIVSGLTKSIMAGPQKNAFEELEQAARKALA